MFVLNGDPIAATAGVAVRDERKSRDIARLRLGRQRCDRRRYWFDVLLPLGRSRESASHRRESRQRTGEEKDNWAQHQDDSLHYRHRASESDFFHERGVYFGRGSLS